MTYDILTCKGKNNQFSTNVNKQLRDTVVLPVFSQPVKHLDVASVNVDFLLAPPIVYFAEKQGVEPKQPGCFKSSYATSYTIFSGQIKTNVLPVICIS